MGYGGTRKDAGKAIGKSGDEGIDGIINEDRLGLDVIYIQAKRWQGTVSRPEIQKFVGALQGQKARKGIFITTSAFSKQAQEYASMIENNVDQAGGLGLLRRSLDFHSHNILGRYPGRELSKASSLSSWVRVRPMSSRPFRSR